MGKPRNNKPRLQNWRCKDCAQDNVQECSKLSHKCLAPCVACGKPCFTCRTTRSGRDCGIVNPDGS